MFLSRMIALYLMILPDEGIMNPASHYFLTILAKYGDMGRRFLAEDSDMAGGNPKYTLEDDGMLIVWKSALRIDMEDRYDWEAFYLEIIRRASRQNGQPFDAETLRDEMRFWCLLNWRRCPTETLLRDKLAPVCPESDEPGMVSDVGAAPVPEAAEVPGERPVAQQPAPRRAKKQPNFFFAEGSEPQN